MPIFFGEIISLNPAVLRPGQRIKLTTKWRVWTTSWWEANLGWWAGIEITLGGMSEKFESGMFYSHIKEFNSLIEVGPDVMPNHDLFGDIVITCYKGGFSSYSEIVYSEPIQIKIPTGNEENGENGFGLPLIPLAIAASVGIVVIAVISKRKG